MKLEDDARHVAVFCNGCWYKLDLYLDDANGRRANPAELERYTSID